MRVRIRLVCADLEVPEGIQEIDIADGATVEQALAAYVGLYPIDDPDNTLPESLFLIDKTPAQLDTVLQDNDQLMVLRILYGG